MNPESGTLSYTYDNNGNVLSRTDARNFVTNIAYDVLNRPTSKSYQNDGGLTPAVAYFYDSQTLPAGAPTFDRGYSTGRLVAVTYGGGSAGSYAGFDALGRTLRKIQQTDSINYLGEASYNVSGAMTSETYPSVPGASDRRTVTYGFDTAGRLGYLNSNATSYAPLATVTNITYASHGALGSETYGNGLVHAATYNNRLQVGEIKLGTGGSPTSILDLVYNYGTTSNNSNLQSVNYSGGGLNYTQSFSYDSLNRLATAQENSGTSWSQTNGYDRYGNRWISLPGGGQSIYCNTSDNRITGWSYDAVGNLLNDGVNNYTYDAEGHIKTVNATTAYVYDGGGARVRKLVGENMRFVYGIGGELIMEFDGSTGNLKKEYLSGGITIEPTAVNSNGTQYGMGDHLGTSRVITNASGNVVSRHDYMPFGEELGAGTGGRTTGMGFSNSGDNNRKKFTGYERDTETGLDFAQARYDSSSLGRFTSPDPFSGSMSAGDPQSFNRYAYVGNNPVDAIDPTGLAGERLGAGTMPGDEGALGRFNPGSGLDPTMGVERSPANHPDRTQQAALAKLDQLARQADKAKDSALAAGLRLARTELANAIAALRPGQSNVGINVAVWAILNIGNTNFGQEGTVTVGTVNGQPHQFGPGTHNKCNVLVAGAHADGAGKGFIDNGQTGKGYPLTDGEPPVANYLGDEKDTKHLTNLSIVKGALWFGDIIAWRNTSADANHPGHSSIYIGGGVVVYAGSARTGGVPTVNLLSRLNHDLTAGYFGTSWGAEHYAYVVRRYNGP